MTAVSTKTHSVVTANIAARSVVWCANESLRVLLQIVQSRGLPIDDLHEDLEFYSKGLRTWMATHHLKAVLLEVWEPDSDKVLERYDLVFDYRPFVAEAEEQFETHIEKLMEALPAKELPAGCRYRIVLKKNPEAPDLPGWGSTRLRSADHLQRKTLGDVIETAAIGVDVVILS